MYLETIQLVDYALPDTYMIFDCQFHPEKENCIGFATIEGDIKMYVYNNLCIII